MKVNKKNRYESLFIIIFLISIFLLRSYNKKVSTEIINVSGTKLEEITNMYIKQNIVPVGYETNNLIKINKNNKDEILYVDINTEEANKIMLYVVEKIQNCINEMNFDDKLLKKNKNNIYILLPLYFTNGSLTSNLGPKVPVKLSFYEQVLASIDTEVVNYGINNALLKIYLTIDLEQKIYVPFKNEKFNRRYQVLLSAKVINGTVPSILGTSLTNQEQIKLP